eukprot:gene13646-biopygen11087
MRMYMRLRVRVRVRVYTCIQSGSPSQAVPLRLLPAPLSRCCGIRWYCGGFEWRGGGDAPLRRARIPQAALACGAPS